MSQPRGKQMIFAPLTMAQIQVLRDEGQLNQVQAFAATAELMAALNYDSTMLQDAEYAALSYASVQYLLQPEPVRQRSVLAAEVDSDSVSRAANRAYGEVSVTSLQWKSAVAVFVDDPDAAAAVTEAHHAIHDADLPGAWDDAHVADLIRDHGLLWHLPAELDQIG